MRTRALFFWALVFSALASTALAGSPSDDTKGPVILTESEMDTVTASALFVFAESLASTVGTGGLTYAETQTRSVSGQYVEMGFGRAEALACCGAGTTVGVSLEGAADGLIVRKISSVRIIRTPWYSLAIGWIVVISINPPSF